MIQAVSPFRIGAVALASAIALGFLGMGLSALRLPQGVIALPAPPEPAEPPAPEPDLHYMALRDPLVIAGTGNMPRIGLELGVAIDAADVPRAQTFLRDQAGAIDAPLAEAVLRLAEQHQGDAPDWTALRLALPDAMLSVLNDRFEQAGEGRPILEVLVIDFSAR